MHSSSPASSVSPSQAFTSNKLEDLATRSGFLAFFDPYCARRSPLHPLASSRSSSSSDPKRSMPSSSSLPSAAPLSAVSATFSRQAYWSGLPFPPPRDLPDPGIKPTPPVSLALQVGSLLLEP
ncbi:hypothetical protein K5549_012676 [Capra hircus]|nr:hypothetical protein K5549_012676 [Capra hircus]